jgi:catechol 2,3-dioxygenase-like lactoylglutathione lyase family enzyme
MPMHLHHLALRSTDVRALADFYREVFAMTVVRDAMPRSLWLGLGGDSVLMIEAREPGEPAPAAGSMELVAFRVDEAAKALVRRKAVERGCFDGETEFTVYLRDPEGRRVAVSTFDLASATR